MRVVTIVSLGASAVLGLGALIVAKTVLPNQAAAKGAAAQTAGVAVVVAAKDMKFGDKVDADHLRLTRLPVEAVPQGAFTSVAAVLSADHGGAPVVLTPIAEREPVLPAKLSGPGARASVAAEIKEGLRAYTIKVTDVSGVGGHALPGDRVDVVLLRDMTPSGATRNFVSQVVLQDVRVLAIDLNADLASNKPATPSTATLEVSVEDSQKLAVAADLGKLSLALRRTGNAEVATTTPVRTSEFGASGGGGSVSAGGSVGGGAPAPRTERRIYRSAPATFRILIIEGDRRGGGGGHRAPVMPTPAAAPTSAPTAAAATLG